jgi:hypothetical protein
MTHTSKTNKHLLITLTLIIPIVLLIGCTDENQQASDKYEQKLIGTWSYFEGGQLTFTSEQTAIITDISRLQTKNLDGTYDYDINNNELTFSNNTIAVTFNFSFGTNTLTLTEESGGTLTFNKT